MLRSKSKRVVPIRTAHEEIPSEETPYIFLLEQEQKKILEEIATKLLNNRQLAVFSQCNNLFGEGKRNYADIGRDLGITRARVAQIEERAVEKIMQHYKSALAVIKREIFAERVAAQGKRLQA
jgi:DNA-directed RNA polymerase sigma subunit (sigma70/sigma32)